MKLRIKGNSIRLRLTQTEIEQIRQGKPVSETVYFGSGPFTYTLRPDPDLFGLEAQFLQGEMLVRIPAAQATNWAASDLVGIEKYVAGSASQQLHLLIEKDFQCLHKRPNENETDHFPNPLAAKQ